MVNKKLYYLGVVLCIMLIFSSCVRMKDTVYLQGDIAKKLDEVSGRAKMAYHVKVGDLLFIRVTSAYDAQSIAFLDAGGSTEVPNALSASLMGHRVGIDGCIDFPFCGKIHVAGLLLSEVEKKVEIAVSKFVKESNVSVKLLNDIITILGEVKTPGRFPLNSEEINLLEAIAFAGDLTDFANRKRVRLIRNDDRITPQMIIIDLTDEKILFSPYFYLKAGDIIYVEPKRSKLFSLSSMPVSLFTSIVSLGLMLYMIATSF